jgi:hypothetical protein
MTEKGSEGRVLREPIIELVNKHHFPHGPNCRQYAGTPFCTCGLSRELQELVNELATLAEAQTPHAAGGELREVKALHELAEFFDKLDYGIEVGIMQGKNELDMKTWNEAMCFAANAARKKALAAQTSPAAGEGREAQIRFDEVQELEERYLKKGYRTPEILTSRMTELLELMHRAAEHQ